jgi:hypothetical protein
VFVAGILFAFGVFAAILIVCALLFTEAGRFILLLLWAAFVLSLCGGALYLGWLLLSYMQSDPGRSAWLGWIELSVLAAMMAFLFIVDRNPTGTPGANDDGNR